MTGPVKNPNEDLQTRAKRLGDKAKRTRKNLLARAKTENLKAKTFTNVAKIEKLKANRLSNDVITKTASKHDLLNFLRSY